jgi:hypothetical protein
MKIVTEEPFMLRARTGASALCTLLIVLAAGVTTCRPAASADIFGSVGPDGAIVLSDTPGGGLSLIVPGSSGGQADAAKPPPAAAGPAHLASVIDEASRNFRLRPELLRAVIEVESQYHPDAVSKKGAQGLMQLMPQTARRFSAGSMFNPRANVLAGAQYLRFLLDLFKDDLELALAAYNAGEQAVLRAGNRIPPFPETRSYVTRVLARYRRLLAAA